jgi:hypothetical protein
MGKSRVEAERLQRPAFVFLVLVIGFLGGRLQVSQLSLSLLSKRFHVQVTVAKMYLSGMYEPPKNPPGDGISEYGNVIVTGRELANVLGLSEAHVFTLKRRNVLQPIRARKNQYHLGPAVQAYVQYKCGQDSAAVADFHRERALKEKAIRELREILVQQTRSQLHRAEDVEAIVEDSNAGIHRRLLAFGKLLTLQVTGKTDPTEVKDIIDKLSSKTPERAPGI